MKIQLALDRLTIAEAIHVASAASPFVDWIEVGTSLIKEFGMESIRAMRSAFPNHTILADMKTFDNAVYEMEICFQAGANVATVMGAAPLSTIQLCKQVADEQGAHLMIDLLSTNSEKRSTFAHMTDVTWCYHVSKDEQESQGSSASGIRVDGEMAGIHVAVAGGVRLGTIDELKSAGVDVVIVGTAITKADDVAKAAKEFSDAVRGQ